MCWQAERQMGTCCHMMVKIIIEFGNFMNDKQKQSGKILKLLGDSTHPAHWDQILKGFYIVYVFIPPCGVSGSGYWSEFYNIFTESWFDNPINLWQEMASVKVITWSSSSRPPWQPGQPTESTTEPIKFVKQFQVSTTGAFNGRWSREHSTRKRSGPRPLSIIWEFY